MENKNKQTIIPLQLPKELQEELQYIQNKFFTDKSEEEWYTYVIRTGLLDVKEKSKGEKKHD